MMVRRCIFNGHSQSYFNRLLMLNYSIKGNTRHSFGKIWIEISSWKQWTCKCQLPQPEPRYHNIQHKRRNPWLYSISILCPPSNDAKVTCTMYTHHLKSSRSGGSFLETNRDESTYIVHTYVCTIVCERETKKYNKKNMLRALVNQCPILDGPPIP